jgi:hypothetical protein
MVEECEERLSEEAVEQLLEVIHAQLPDAASNASAAAAAIAAAAATATNGNGHNGAAGSASTTSATGATGNGAERVSTRRQRDAMEEDARAIVQDDFVHEERGGRDADEDGLDGDGGD